MRLFDCGYLSLFLICKTLEFYCRHCGFPFAQILSAVDSFTVQSDIGVWGRFVSVFLSGIIIYCVHIQTLPILKCGESLAFFPAFTFRIDLCNPLGM